MVSIPACHAGDRGSIPRRGDFWMGGIIAIDTPQFTASQILNLLFFASSKWCVNASLQQTFAAT